MTRGTWLIGSAVGVALVALAALVTASFTYGLVWEKPEGPGIPWSAVESS